MIAGPTGTPMSLATLHIVTILNWPMPFGSRLLPYKERPLALFACPLGASPRPWAPPPEASPAARDLPQRGCHACHHAPLRGHKSQPPTPCSQFMQTNDMHHVVRTCMARKGSVVSDGEQTCDSFRWHSPSQGSGTHYRLTSGADDAL